jgi:hypothetical protein
MKLAKFNNIQPNSDILLGFMPSVREMGGTDKGS